VVSPESSGMSPTTWEFLFWHREGQEEMKGGAVV